MSQSLTPHKKCIQLTITGAVQGVGFRPFIYRLASECGLTGWVNNTSEGVLIEAEGEEASLTRFIERIKSEKPRHARIHSMRRSDCQIRHHDAFEIRQSEGGGKKTALVLPDIGTCDACLKELFDPDDRRYLYPFINCTHCGPRFSIIETLPYDRPNTSMKKFPMCPACEKEYTDPANRRFHAQPNACPECGPRMEFWNEEGNALSHGHEAVLQACEAIRQGRIAAVKGIGGFHLMVDARNEEAVRWLRERKKREEKPLACLFPYLRLVEEFCEVSTMEKQFLLSPEAPIVLLRKKEAAASKLANSIAPDNPTLGVMMPSNPLHHIMMRELGFPLVATSGNLTDEPICIDEKEAQVRLRAIADFFLMHNRPIVRHVDDSVLRVVLGRELMLRRARGYAPLPITVKENLPAILSVGGHLKNTIAVSKDRNVFLSQHIGDLETSEAYHAFEEVARSLRNMYDIVPGMVVSDRHPNYISTQYAEKLGIPHVSVQHHHAHIAACLAEHQLDGPVLGVSWDGTGYGDGQTIWGGEFLHAKKKEYKRFAHFRPFPLPSGDRAVKEPRRTALGLLYAMLSEEEFLDADWLPFQSFERNDLILIKRMLIQNINCPLVCSVGRLFDAVASLIGLRHQVSFEGQAAIALEHSIRGNERGHYPYTFHKTETMHMIDWEPMIREILSDWEKQVSPPAIAAKFHNTLVEIIVSVAKKCKENTIILSGGCFQNTYLLEQSVTRLKQEGFQAVWHRRIPPNDGGIALGQLIAAFHREKT